MISPGTFLYIYEIKGSLVSDIAKAPTSYLGIWNEDDFIYLFFTKNEDGFVDKLLISEQATLSALHEMKYSDWQAGLPDIGLELAGIRIAPVGAKDTYPDALLLDPSVVFGDGNHPTTVACAEGLADLIKSDNIESMIDLGAGSGILSLIAAKLNVKTILAVDKNILAAETTRKNIRINGYSEIIKVEIGEARHYIEKPADVVTANLPFSVLRELAPLKDAGLHRYWIISGVNSDQGKLIEELLIDQNYRITREIVSDPWFTFIAEKN